MLTVLGRVGPLPRWNEIRGAAIAGTWIIIGGVGVVTITEVHAPSNLTAVLASTTSLWVVGYRALGGERIARGAILGAAIGIVGVFVLLSPGGSGADNPWLILAIVAALFWSTGSFYGRRLTQPADPFVGAVVQMIVAGTSCSSPASPSTAWTRSIRPSRPRARGSRSRTSPSPAPRRSAPTSGRSSTSRSRPS